MKIQLEAVITNSYGKLGKGTFGGKCPRYIHSQTKPSIAKIIIDIAKSGGGKLDALVKLFDEEGDDSSALEAGVTSLLTESTRRLLGTVRIDRASINTRASIMSEYQIKLTSWIKESSKLEDENVKMYGLIYANCDTRLRQELDKEAEFADIRDASDGFELSLLIAKVLSVSSTKHKHLAKSEAEKHFNALSSSKHEDIHALKQRFDEALTRRKAAGLTDVADEDQARIFLDKLDLERFGDSLADLHNESAGDDSVFPKTLDEAYSWASRKVIFKARSAQGTGPQIISLTAAATPTSTKETKSAKKDANNVICFNCGNKGHYANNCKSKKVDSDSASSKSKSTTAAAVKTEDKEQKKKKKKRTKKKKAEEDPMSIAALDFGSSFITFPVIRSDRYL
jgi:hypothetical protein